MEEYIKYVIVCLVVLFMDAIWIGSNVGMYGNAVKLVQGSEMVVRYHYVVLAYIVVLLSTIFMAIPFTKYHLTNNDTMLQKLYKSLRYGGLSGFIIYAIYNLTSLSIYKDYDVKVAIFDTLWGTFLNTFVVFVYTLL
jgi:uncharacterized membrane protein